MFYIDHYCEDGRIAVADSDDGAIDLITKKELQDYTNQGIQILTWQDAKGFVTARMNHNCNYYLWRKLNRNCSEDELMEYFQKYSNYTVVHNTQQFGVDYNARCRVFKYSETSNYFIVVLFLKGGFPLIMRINDEYECIAQVIQTPCIFKSYPSCSGFLIKNLLKRKNIVGDFNIVSDETYLLFYDRYSGDIILFNEYTFNVTYIKGKGVVLC